MHGNHGFLSCFGMAINMMAATDSREVPTTLLKDTTSVYLRQFSSRFPCRLTGHAILVCHCKPSLGGFPEIGAHLLERFTLGVAARQGRYGS